MAPGQDALFTVPGLDPDGLHRLAVRLTEATGGLGAALTPHRKRLRLLPGPPGGGRAAPHPRPERRLQRPGRRQAGICQGSCAAGPEAVARFLRSQAGAGPIHTDKE